MKQLLADKDSLEERICEQVKILEEALNVATVAAWRIHCFIEKSLLSQLEFRRHIALSLLQSDGSAPLEAVAVFCCTYPSFSSMYSLYRTKGTL
ncbi:hypothetical protein T02_1412 [Trichinella nativa]|uniref:Uncharacterized protein n=1 Tax=Trichinella nativa TaxID=6335 RepID=A0A0V1KPZ7_9BILA|nr:hypothetical protein T02_7786 [Trichinella nativa]KRZ48981.1 hypothetical protein T02_1412 [Trichinella nativa]